MEADSAAKLRRKLTKKLGRQPLAEELAAYVARKTGGDGADASRQRKNTAPGALAGNESSALPNTDQDKGASVCVTIRYSCHLLLASPPYHQPACLLFHHLTLRLHVQPPPKRAAKGAEAVDKAIARNAMLKVR